jgi:hypothetical protein
LGISVPWTTLIGISSYDHEFIIAVLVGPDEHRFAVRKDVICAKSKFFRAACSTRWLKDGERVV